ncbi:hypothetical protein Sjap_024004 [Stephania japonica]|uniref:K+ potassium transporter integral membrane domain-containing protein n=1 Tax=Stephania japonica TaxID=461633 RepID=A0AAP0EHF0_9MAGN
MKLHISFSSTVFPAILCAYAGQAAYLTKFPGDVTDTFYKSIPHYVSEDTLQEYHGHIVIWTQAEVLGARLEEPVLEARYEDRHVRPCSRS